MKHLLSFLTLLLLFIIACSNTSCWGFFNKPYTGIYVEQKRWAWKPVYSVDTTYNQVSYEAARPVENAGKIYVKDNFIYQCEVGAGIHVIDNTNPATAKRVGFIKVPGCEEISIKGNILYTNNFYDLISVNIANLNDLHILSRTKNAFTVMSGLAHTWEQPKDTGYYQCPAFYLDSVVVNWVKDSVVAYCYK